MARSFSFALIAGLLFFVVIVINIIASSNRKMEDDHMHGGGSQVKNLVLFVGSGLGPAGVTLARGVQEALRKGEASVPAALSFEPFLTATLRTRSASSRLTDAAAAGSALASGKKTANGMIAIDPQSKKNTASVLEMAKQAGLKTGFITTAKLTESVAAAFTVHMESLMPSMVAQAQLNAKFDLLMGGGKSDFKLESWKNASYSVHTSAEDLQKAGSLPVLGVFADEGLEFAIDRKSSSKQPTLSQMTRKALDLLNNPKGFVLVVEAGNIDDCASNNDAACLAHEVLALQEAFDVVADLLVKSKDTACLVTSDRDAGGLSLNDWDPSKLAQFNASAQSLSNQFKAANADVKALMLQHTGISLSDSEVANLKSAAIVGSFLSSRVGVTWGALSGTAVDVNLYVCGDSSADVPRGNVDNTAVGAYLMKKLPASKHDGMPMGGGGGHGGGHHH